MSKLSYFLLAALTIITFTQCDDNTESVGSSIVPSQDVITARTDTFYAKSRTILANDSILASSSEVYLGYFSDAESGTIFESSFITQFGCTEDFGFPEEGVAGDTATYTKLRLYFDEYYGDSLNALYCNVYELDNTLQEGKPYYTNLDPSEFYDSQKAPIASKAFNVIDYTLHDTILNGDYTRHVEITLPNSIGNRFIKKFYEEDAEGNHIGKNYFANAENFINDVFKGIYVECASGDGTVLKIYRARLDVGFNRYIKSSSGELDSIQALTAPFYSGKEVLQANKFNNNDLARLADEKEHTYIKTPAGLFTEVELPITEIVGDNDTININSAKISFTRYNKSGSVNDKPHNTLLMVRKKELYRFFLRNSLADGKTSYLTSFNSSTNEYEFSNIANLIRQCYKEYTEGTETNKDWATKNPDWNKVVLIPVTTTEDGNGSIVKIVHDISISSVKLRGGNSYDIPIQVVISKFND